MRERVRNLKAASIRSNAGGTTISVILPISPPFPTPINSLQQNWAAG